jgi:release factor glutamine methyltransferase
MDEGPRCKVMEYDIALERDQAVFAPTLTTSVLTAQIDPAQVLGRVVLDMGCGSGPIAIAMARAGARKVVAVDLMPEACELARRNAALNGVADRVTVLQGDLFAPVRGMAFDLIVDDVSGVADEVAQISSWFPSGVPAGGEDGTVHTVRMLRSARDHLAPGGRLLFPVLSLSRAQEVIRVAREVFGDGLRRLATQRIPFNPALRANGATLERLKRAGMLDFTEIRSRRFWTLEVYCAQA